MGSPFAVLRLLLLSSLILLMGLPIFQSALGTDYGIFQESNQFRVVLKVNAGQNLTGFSGNEIYPENLTSTLTGQELVAFETTFQNSFREKVSTVRVSQATVRVTSSPAVATCSPSCPVQWLNMTAEFLVQDSPPSTGGVAQYDMSWKAFRVEEDLKADGVSFNRLGEKYLLSQLLPFLTVPPSFTRTMIVTVGAERVSTETYQVPTQSIVLLDLSPFRTPLEMWNQTLDLSEGRRIWTSPDNGGFTVSGLLRISEPDVSIDLPYLAMAQVSAELSASFNSFAKGDTLFVDLSGGLGGEMIGLAIIISSVGILVTATVLERRTLRGAWGTKRKKSK